MTDNPKIIALTPVGKTPDERMNFFSDTVYELAVSHMIGGLRIANRLRHERGAPALTGSEILQLLGQKDHCWIALRVLVELLRPVQGTVNNYPQEMIDALQQARAALGEPPFLFIPGVDAGEFPPETT